MRSTRIVCLLLGLTVSVVLIAPLREQQRELAAARADQVENAVKLAFARTRLEGEAAPPPLETLAAEIRALESQLAPIEKQPAPAPPPLARNPSPAERFAAGVEGLRQDPQYREHWRREQRRFVQKHYGSSFSMLELSPDELEQLKELTIERLESTRDARRLAEKQGLDADSPIAARLLSQAAADVQSEIRRLLGPERFRLYQRQMSLEVHRLSLQSFQLELADRGLSALTPVQERQLIEARHFVRSPENPERSVHGDEIFGDPGNRQICGLLADSLSTAQLEALRAFLDHESQRLTTYRKVTREVRERFP